MTEPPLFTDANPSGATDAHFPCELVEDGRGVVGAWWITPEIIGLPGGGTVLQSVVIRGLLRMLKGNPRGLYGRTIVGLLPSCDKMEAARQSALQLVDTQINEHRSGIEVPPTPRFSDMLFAIGVDKPGWLTTASFNRPRERGRADARTSTSKPGDMLGVDDEHVETYRRAKRIIAAKARPFIETLDPEALAYASSPDLPAYAESRNWLSDDVWSGIDATFTPGAPLRRLLRAAPQHGDRLLSLWGRDRSRFEGPITEALAAACRHPALDDKRALAGKLMAGKFLEDAVAISAACGSTERAPTPVFERNLAIGVRTKQSEMLRIMQGLPLDWLPSDAAEWRALAGLSRPLCEALNRVDAPSNPVLFNARGRWAEFGKRLEKACAPTGLDSAVKDLRDVTWAFYQQVIMPANAREFDGDKTRLQAKSVWRLAGLLSDGRSLPRFLEMSRRWHGRQAGIEARLAALSPEAAEAWRWPPGLPDWRPGDIDVVVLTSKAMLGDEGLRGANADGTTGLAHCVGGYGQTCRTGKSRIVSLRRRLPSGGFERLSTAEIDVDLECPPLFNVIQHRGLANLPPPDEAARVLEAYLSMCRRDELPVDRLGLAPMSAIDTVEEQCGYDWRKPGNVEKAIAIWSPCLPGHVRRMTPREIATRTLEGSDHRSDHQCR